MSSYNQTSSFVIPRDSVQHINDSVQQILQKEYHVQAVLSPVQTPWRKKRKEVAITLKALSHWPQFRDAKKYLKLKLPSTQFPPTPPHVLIQRGSWSEEPVEIAPHLCRRQTRRGEKYSTEVTAVHGLESEEKMGVNTRNHMEDNTITCTLPNRLSSVEYIASNNDEILKVSQETPKKSKSEMTTPKKSDVSDSIMKKFDPRMQSPALSVEVLNVNKKVSDVLDSSYINAKTLKRLERCSAGKRKSIELCSSGAALIQSKKPRASIESIPSQGKRKSKARRSKKLRKQKKVTNRKVELHKNKKGFIVTLPNCTDISEGTPDVIDISNEEIVTDQVINDSGPKDRTSNRGENFSFTLEGGKRSEDGSAEFTFKISSKDLKDNVEGNRRPFRFSAGLNSSVADMSENLKCVDNPHKHDTVASENSDIHIISPKNSEKVDVMDVEDSEVIIVSAENIRKDVKLKSDSFDVHIISPEAPENVNRLSESSDIHVVSPEELDIQYVPDVDVTGTDNKVSDSVCSQFSKRQNEISSAADYIEIVKIIPHQCASKVSQIKSLTPRKNVFKNKNNKKSVRRRLENSKTEGTNTVQQTLGGTVSNFCFQAPSLLPVPVGSHLLPSVPQTDNLFRNSVVPAFRFSMPDKPYWDNTSSVACSSVSLPLTSSNFLHTYAETGSSRKLDVTSATAPRTRRNKLQLGLYGNNIYTPKCNHSGEQGRLRPVVIDGSNVAMAHGKHSSFSCRGIAICVDYFLKRGHEEVHAFVPQFRRKSGQAVDSYLLEKLERTGHVIFTPSRTLQKRTITCYDDRFIVQYAASCGGVIVSRDNFRDLLQENQSWRETIENRLLMYTWVGDTLMFPQDPLGRHGPTLDEFLSFSDK